MGNLLSDEHMKMITRLDPCGSARRYRLIPADDHIE